MLQFLFVLVFGWILLSLGVGVYQFAIEKAPKQRALESSKHVLLFPYSLIKMLIEMYKK